MLSLSQSFAAVGMSLNFSNTSFNLELNVSKNNGIVGTNFSFFFFSFDFFFCSIFFGISFVLLLLLLLFISRLDLKLIEDILFVISSTIQINFPFLGVIFIIRLLFLFESR